MKYAYITGLEHSGTTLLAHLVGQAENVVALGEVAQLFSAEQMRGHIAKWGKYPGVRLCSCGAYWEEYEFWSRFYQNSRVGDDRLEFIACYV